MRFKASTASARRRSDSPRVQATARRPSPRQDMAGQAGVPIFLRRRSGQPDLNLRTPRETVVPVAGPGDRYEREADAAAARLQDPGSRIDDHRDKRKSPAFSVGPSAAPQSSPIARSVGSTGSALDAATRQHMEERFTTSFEHVRVHTGPPAESLNRALGSSAFTHGRDIFFGRNQAPGNNPLTAHELTHVVQQSSGSGDSASGRISRHAGPAPIQCSFAGTYTIPGSPSVFEIELVTREGALGTPPTKSGMDGYIRFVPVAGSPNSNVIGMTQVNRTIDASTGADLNAASMPAAQAPRGALGDPGLRTREDSSRGIEGGFKTDVLHRPNASSPGVPQGSFLSPRYAWGAAPPGTTGFGGTTQQPDLRGAGIGADPAGQTPGFKRSDDSVDIRTASMYDFPGTNRPGDQIDWTFESAAIGEDTMVTYGVVHWGFGVHGGHVVNEHLHVEAGQSATFAEALERHRDFYVHEPVTFYFPFDSAALSGAEASKIDTFTAYLTRNPDVQMSLEGFADMIGGNSDYNRDLSLQRAEAVQNALIARGIAPARIDGIVIGRGASTSATTDAGTSDEGGNPGVGADQRREANRWANRRVILIFRHVPATP